MNSLIPKALTVPEVRFFYQLPLLVLAAFGCVELIVPGVTSTFAGWPLVLSLVFVGMPHGAVDFQVNSRLRSVSDLPSQMWSFLGYCCVLAGVLALLLVAPLFTLLGFLVASATHFGIADARYLDRLTPNAGPQSKANSCATRLSAFARGTLVIALPFLCFETASLEVFGDVMAVLGQPSKFLSASLVRPSAILFCLAALITHAVVTALRFRHAHIRTATTELVETCTIVFAFWTLHPLFAMGLYVLAWHGWRHMQPLSRFFRDSELYPNYHDLLRSVWRIHIRSLPLLIPTLVIVGCLGWWRLESWTSTSLAALTITIFAVVTLPHHLLVEQLLAGSGRGPREGSSSGVAAHREYLSAKSPKALFSTAMTTFNLQEDKTWASR